MKQQSTSKELNIQKLNVYFGDLHALRNIDMQLPGKGITACIGPTRCGKSVLLRVLNRMTEEPVHVEGCITLNDRDTQRDIYRDIHVFELRRRIALIYSRPSIFPATIWQNTAFGPRVNGLTSRTELDAIVETALKTACLWEELKDRLHKPALRLSESQQQRLCIARALALNPDFLLLDEPTSSLDPIATGRIEELLEFLKESIGIVLVTHAVQQASRVSDRTAFFMSGELIEYAATEELYLNPSDRRTADYISGRFS